MRLSHIEQIEDIKNLQKIMKSQGVDVSNLGITNSGVSLSFLKPSSASTPEGEETSGYDYSKSPIDVLDYTCYRDRMNHIDTYFGSIMLYKFSNNYNASGTSYTDGHRHNGTDGHGPMLDAGNILASSTLSDAETIADHVKDKKIHAGYGSDFEADGGLHGVGLSPYFSIIYGSASSSGSTITLAPNTIIRFNAELRDSFTSAFKLKATGSDYIDIHVRKNPDGASIHHVMRFGENGCGICEFNESDETLEEISEALPTPLPNIQSSSVPCKIEVYGPRLQAWGNTYVAKNNKTAYATPAISGGAFEIRTNSCGAIISDFAITRNFRFDAIDFTDNAGRAPTVTAGVHAGNHASTGHDYIDISNLADTNNRMLSHQEKAMVAYLDNADLHEHLAADVSTQDTEADQTLGRASTLLEHVLDDSIHVQAHESPGVILGFDAYDTYANLSGGTNDAGYAYGDHSHIIPFWLMDNQNGQEYHAASSEYFDTMMIDVSGGVAVPTRRYPMISLAGELAIPDTSDFYIDTVKYVRFIARMRVMAEASCTARLHIANGMRGVTRSGEVVIVHKSVSGTTTIDGGTIVPDAGKWQTAAFNLAAGYNDFIIRLAPQDRSGFDYSFTWVTSSGLPDTLFNPQSNVRFVSPLGKSDAWWNTLEG